MRKLIARYDETTTAQSVATADANSVTGVTATLEIDLIPAVIVDVKPGQVNAVERRLRQRRSITRVERPKQAFPQVVDPQYLTDFFARVDRERGYQLPLAGSQTRTEVVTQAAETQRELQQRKQATPDADREISTVDEAYANIGTDPTAVDTSNVIAANLDEGVHPSQFASERRMSGFSPTDAGPYEPSGPHGSYTMGVMAGGPATTGIDRAPLSEADIYPLRVNFGGADMLACLDDINRLRAAEDRPIIFNNSWGYRLCDGRCSSSVNDAFTALASKPGIVIIASAGNDARECGQSCTGTGNNGIASFRTSPNVISVALSGEFGNPRKMVYYSSRGPGSCNDTLEPTTIAPLNGIVPYGDGSDNLGANVGTSGSAPMVAAVIGQGIAAAGHDVSTPDITEAIKTTGVQWKGSGHSICTGWGEINPPTTVPAIAAQPPDEGRDPVTAAFETRGEQPLPINEEVTFDASESSSVGGNIEQYDWEVANGTFNGQNGDLSVITPTGGELDVTLTVRSSGGGTDTTTNQYQVEERPNQPPTARASVSDDTVTPPDTVTFSAEASTDPDGQIQTYGWTFWDGVTARGAVQTRSFDTTDAGLNESTLVVTDDDGATDRTTITVSVEEPSNTPPTARATASPPSITPPGAVGFDGTDSFDPDGQIQSYEWSFSDGVSRRGSTVVRSFTTAATGSVTGVLTVTDNSGKTDVATATAVLEGSGNEAPSASISVSASER